MASDIFLFLESQVAGSTLGIYTFFQESMSSLRLLVPAAKATPTPPVGPALGQRGIKSMDFCKQFNEQTSHYTPGIPIPTTIEITPNRTFTFVVKPPPTSWLLRQAAGLEKGSARAKDVVVAQLSLKHIYEIAKVKKDDPAFMDSDLKQVASRIIGQASGMGIQIVP